MSEELRPCPFCNIPPASKTSKIDGKEYYSCLVADCPNGSWFTADEWNTRPIEDALRLRIAELEESDKHWAGNVKVCMQLIERYESDIAELEASRRWIPVGERLPEERQNVLALDRTGTAYHWEYSRSLSNIFVSDYTHWMPLPEVPNV